MLPANNIELHLAAPEARRSVLGSETSYPN
jgi:hypothetical protein